MLQGILPRKKKIQKHTKGKNNINRGENEVWCLSGEDGEIQKRGGLLPTGKKAPVCRARRKKASSENGDGEDEDSAPKLCFRCSVRGEKRNLELRGRSGGKVTPAKEKKQVEKVKSKVSKGGQKGILLYEGTR